MNKEIYDEKRDFLKKRQPDDEKCVASPPLDPWKVLFELRRIGKWNVRLTLSGLKPRLSASLKNKQLKTIPDSFSKMPESQPYTEAVTLLEQAIPYLKKIKPSVKYGNYYDFYNSEEIKEQVVNQQIMTKALQNIPDKILTPYLNALRTNNSDYSEFVMMIEAFKGSNRAKLEKAIVRHGQAALKAYGLLPTQSKKEIAQRYITLKKAWKECSKYGAERQANTRAAVQIGLENLATRAGYYDSVRMEWDLEADISTDAQVFFEVRTIEQWDVNIALDGIKPILKISKKGKALKSIPVGLRKTKEYPQYRAVMDTLKEQARRFRRSLENMMTGKEVIVLKELKKLTKIPAMQCFLVNLLGINENNEIGLIDPNKLVLIDADKHYEIKETIRIVHTHDLFTQAVLSYWQQQIVEQQIVQPFKQVFRELYILTPAEQESATFTNRFSDRSVDGSIAYRLLQSRGWNQGEMVATKSWASHKLEAHWEFPDIQYYMAAHEELSSSKLYFIANGKWGLSNAIPLQEICPILFSETLRDADLVVSVAQPQENNKTGFWSNEIQQHRISVAKHIAKNLGINDLRFEDKYVYVQGKWNEYTIHLGTANTYLGKKHLCIGSDIRSRKKKIYLPFADMDTTISEIIAKILLLKHDDKITDNTILGQIRPHKASMLED